MDCLVTKLKGTVSDENIAKLGEYVVQISAGGIVEFKVYSTLNTVNLRIVGNGYFTNSDGLQNLGKNKTIEASQDDVLYLSAGNYDIYISDKYSLDTLQVNMSVNMNNKISLDIDNLYANNLTRLQVANGGTGDLTKYFNNKNINLVLLDTTDFTGDISNLFKEYVGDPITSISLLRSKGIYGDITNILLKTNIASMSGFEGCGALTGDLSKAWTGTYFITFNSVVSTDFSWQGERSSSAYILALENYPNFGNYLDAMLINQAKCQKSPSALQSYHLTITATGTRTSASDSAISTLQEKGFTVTVPAATDAKSISTMSLDSGNYGIAYKDKELIVEPIDLTKMQIYPAKGVSVQKFDTLENAEKFIFSSGLVKSEIK